MYHPLIHSLHQAPTRHRHSLDDLWHVLRQPLPQLGGMAQQVQSLPEPSISCRIDRWKSWLHSSWALPLLESLLTLLKALPSLADVDLVMRAQMQETELHGKDPNCERSEFRGKILILQHDSLIFQVDMNHQQGHTY